MIEASSNCVGCDLGGAGCTRCGVSLTMYCDICGSECDRVYKSENSHSDVYCKDCFVEHVMKTECVHSLDTDSGEEYWLYRGEQISDEEELREFILDDNISMDIEDYAEYVEKNSGPDDDFYDTSYERDSLYPDSEWIDGYSEDDFN